MPWVRLDENFADHPKVERVGPLAAWLHVVALCYCARHLSDGRIPKIKAVRLIDVPDPAGQIEALVSEGMWVENGTDYVIHDYLEYQPSRESVLAERSAARTRMAKKRSVARSPELRENIGRSSPSPSRPVPIDIPQSSSSDSRANGERPDDDEISTGDVPDETWEHYAQFKLDREKPGSVKNRGPWKHTTARNARTELGDQAARWWHDFQLTPRRLAECLIDGQIRNVPRRKEPT